jgi:hypothetical protein
MEHAAQRKIFDVLEWVSERGANGDYSDVMKINNKFHEIYKEQKKPLEIVNDKNNLPAAKYAFYLYNKTNSQDSISYEQYEDLEGEHIFAQKSSFSIKRYGFTEKEYEQYINTIGNFTLLEKN